MMLAFFNFEHTLNRLFNNCISGDWYDSCYRFFNIAMWIDWIIEKSGDQSKLVDRSKGWKHFQLLNQSPVFQPAEFFEFYYNQLYYLIKQIIG